MISKKELKKLILKAVPHDRFTVILAFLIRKDPKLWGEDRPNTFIEDTLLIILYKWLTGLGNTAVAVAVSGWLKTSNQSMGHNSKHIASILAIWGRAQITPITPTEREALLGRVQLKKPLTGTTLWMDSTDFRTTGKKSVRSDFNDFSFFKKITLFFRFLKRMNGGVSRKTLRVCDIWSSWMLNVGFAISGDHIRRSYMMVTGSSNTDSRS